jgi:glycosyltransferase involved in cell wall biosynthesis
MKKPILTILTPTWNRRDLLPRLYDSIASQDMSLESFEWLIVDDGSTDGTLDYINTLSRISHFKIRVIRQENGGKCSALNLGASLAQGEWVAIVDSDDMVLPYGISSICKEINYINNRSTCGIFFTLQISGLVRNEFPNNLKEGHYWEWVNKSRHFDITPVLRTSAMLEFPYPLAESERYMAPGFMYHSFDTLYKYRFINRAVVSAEYQPDGLSSQSVKLRSKSSLNAISYYEIELKSHLNIRLRVRSAINLYRFLFHSYLNKKYIKIELKWHLIFSPIGAILFILDLFHLYKKSH